MKRRLIEITWTLLLLAAVALSAWVERHAYVLGMSFRLAEGPGADDRWVVETVAPDGPAHAAGIEGGDRLLEVAGAPATGLSFPFGGQFVHFLPGGSLRRWLTDQERAYEQASETGSLEMQVEHRGAATSLHIQPRHKSWGQILHPGTFARLLMALAFLFAGLGIFSRRPDEEERRAFLGFTGCVSILLLTWWPTFSEDVVPEPRSFRALFLFGNAAAALGIAWGIHFLSIFPRRRFFTNRHPRFHLPLKGFALIATPAIAFLGQPVPMWFLWSVGLPSAGILLADGYLRARLAVNRSRMEWIFVGLILSVTLALFLYVPLLILDRAQYLHQGLVLIALLPIPVTLALAVDSWRLADVRRFLESGIALAATLLVVGGVYVALFSLLAHVPLVLYRQSVIASGLVSIGVVAALLFTQRELVRSALGRMIRGSSAHVAEMTERERVRLFSADSAETVIQLLLEGLNRVFQPSWLVFSSVEANPVRRAVACAADSPSEPVRAFVEANRGAFESALVKSKRAVILAEIPAPKNLGERSLLDGALAPLHQSTGRLAAFVCLGPRPDRQLYDSEALTHLTLLASKAGLLMELFTAREAYERRLLLEKQERERIGREIHDSVGAELTNVILLARSLGRAVGSSSVKVGEAETAVAQLEARAKSALQDVRTAAWALNVPETDEDFVSRLRRYATDVLAPTGTALHFADRSGAAQGAPSSLTPNQKLHLFRFYQEVLSNVARHSKADRVRVEWRHTAESAELSVEDNGIGFDPASPKLDSSGLAGLRHRAEALGGRMNLQSGPGLGTKVRIELACRTSDPSHT